MDSRPFGYLLLVPPSEAVFRKTVNVKREFKDKFLAKNAFGLKPHITIGNWVSNTRLESKISENLKRFTDSIHPFEVQLDGFGSFNSTTIFLNVVNQDSFEKISKKLSDQTKHLLGSSRHFPKVAHLTIARALEPDQFSAAWSQYESKEFKASFQAKEMLLLRKDINSRFSKMELVNTFPFLGKDNNEGGQFDLPF